MKPEDAKEVERLATRVAASVVEQSREIHSDYGGTERTLYKVSSAMIKLDVCRATIYRMAARGELDLVKISERATRVTAESIRRAIAAGRVSRE